MFYRLPDNLSYCQVDDHLVFLDTRKDRYFRLSSAMERAFLAYMKGGPDPGIPPSVLIDHNILVPSSDATVNVPAPSVPCPTRSAVEESRSNDPVDISMLLDVFSVVCSMRAQLAARNLNNILSSLSAYRQSRAHSPAVAATHTEAEHLSQVAVMFWQVRVYVPVTPRCLVDSLSLVKVLARRGLYANIVFGVTSDPFAAHAWVQAGDLVLSDTVGHATSHTPIRIV
ncbi:lasso peptide biosynthesis B2 protein [Luteimonas sp. RIT-PG2_3]